MCLCACSGTHTCFSVKDTDRFSAGGDHSPETFISHYPEREDWREGRRERQKRTKGKRKRTARIKRTQESVGRDKSKNKRKTENDDEMTSRSDRN